MNCIRAEEVKKTADFLGGLANILNNKTIYITGATGLIGCAIVDVLSEISSKFEIEINIICPVRDIVVAQRKINFGRKSNNIKFILQKDITGNWSEVHERVDYVIHAACPTGSDIFVKEPLNIFNIIADSARRFVEFIEEKNVLSALYISSMEVYGENVSGNIDETQLGNIDITRARSSYPLGKLVAEAICNFASQEKELDIRIVRPTLVFGPGISENENRIFAQVLRAVKDNKNFTLHTDGKSERDYLYLFDAVVAILYILVKGNPSETYNISNPDTYCSIYDFVKKAACLGKNTEICIDINDAIASKYMRETHIRLNTDKINRVFNFDKKSLDYMLRKTLESFL